MSTGIELSSKYSPVTVDQNQRMHIAKNPCFRSSTYLLFHGLVKKSIYSSSNETDCFRYRFVSFFRSLKSVSVHVI